MTKRIFDDRGFFKAEHHERIKEFYPLISPWIKSLITEGYDIRDVQLAIHSALDLHIAFEIASLAMKEKND